VSLFIHQTLTDTRIEFDNLIQDFHPEETGSISSSYYYGYIIINDTLYPNWSNGENIN
jgi:hypothetical protein